MSHPDTLLNGSIMAMVAMTLVFDDDEDGSPSTPSGADGLAPDAIKTGSNRPRQSR